MIKTTRISANTATRMLAVFACAILSSSCAVTHLFQGPGGGGSAVKAIHDLGTTVSIARACGIQPSDMTGVHALFSETITLHKAILSSAHASEGQRRNTASEYELTNAYIQGTNLLGYPGILQCEKVKKGWSKFDAKQEKDSEGIRKQIEKVRSRG